MHHKIGKGLAGITWKVTHFRFGVRGVGEGGEERHGLADLPQTGKCYVQANKWRDQLCPISKIEAAGSNRTKPECNQSLDNLTN